MSTIMGKNPRIPDSDEEIEKLAGGQDSDKEITEVEDNTPNWDKELERIVGEHEDIEEITLKEQDNEKAEDTILQLNYDITIDEEDRAFRMFQRLYVYKKNIAATIVFALVGLFFLFQIITKGVSPMRICLMIFAFAMIFITWLTTFRIRKMLLIALETLKDDRYVFRLFKDKFEIETIIPQEDVKLAKELVAEDRENGSFEGEGEDEDYDGDITPSKSEYEYPSDNMKIVETSDMFLIFVSKQVFHILPKRIMTDGDLKILDECFIEKFEDYLKV